VVGMVICEGAGPAALLGHTCQPESHEQSIVLLNGTYLENF